MSDADGERGALPAERAFLTLAREWNEELAKLPPGEMLPVSLDDAALACVVLAVEHGRGFTDRIRQLAQANGSAGAAISRMPWIDQLPWDLCVSASEPSPHQTEPVQLLTGNLAHHNSSIRIWLMYLAWMVRPWLVPEQVFPFLLKNLADTLGHPFEAAALGATLLPDLDRFWKIAEGFVPPSGFEDQYHGRLTLMKDEGILTFQAPFLLREVRCRKRITDAAFSGVGRGPHFSAEAAGTGPPVAPGGEITRERARAIAEEYLSHPATRLGGSRVSHVESPGNIRLGLPIFWGHELELQNSWVAYVDLHQPPGGYLIQSSQILLVSRRTGKVIYAGSARDEG